MRNLQCVIKVFVVILVFGTVFGLAGCGTQMPSYYLEKLEENGEFVPNEETCILFVDNDLTLWGQKHLDAILRIPAGRQTMVFDYSSSSLRHSYGTGYSTTTTTTESASGIEITYDFQPGRRYSVYPVRSDGRRKEPDDGEKFVGVRIIEFSDLVSGLRIGLFPGWLQGLQAPMGGLFYGIQAGWLILGPGDVPMEILMEGNVGASFSPLVEHEPKIDWNVQGGGTVNFGVGKTMLGIGGGVGLGGTPVGSNDWDFFPVPYVRASFSPYTEKTYIRIFMDYSFTQEELWKRFGLGIQIFPKSD